MRQQDGVCYCYGWIPAPYLTAFRSFSFSVFELLLLRVPELRVAVQVMKSDKAPWRWAVGGGSRDGLT